MSADYFAPQGQVLTVNGEDIQAFEFGSAEEADAAAGGVSATGSSIVTTMADGTQKASMVTWVVPPHFYKAGKLIVLYVGCDGDVIDALQETMGPQFAGGAGVSQCPEQVPQTTLEIGQALEAAEGSEVTVSGHLIVDTDGNTRLCSVLMESYPPQCGGDRIDLLGFDATSVPNTETPQRPSEIGTARWTNSQITVTGIKRTGGLAEVQLSTEAPASDEVPTPTPGQLSEWYREAQKVVWPIDGVYSSNIDERRNRIVFGVLTKYVVQQAREALAKTSVPEEAVVFERPPKKRLDDSPVRVDTPIGVSISLEFERVVRVGQSVSIEVVLTNKGDGAVEFGHGTPFYENVMIFTSDGDQVWTKLRRAQAGVAGSTRLQPSETVRLQTLWNQRDQDGFELPAGRYLVRGTVQIVDDLGDDGPFFSGMDLATEPYELIIQP